MKDDLISRQGMLNRLEEWNTDDPTDKALYNFAWNRIIEQPAIEPKIVRCKDCKYFELDHFEKVEGFPVPIIVAHEICMKWGDGCKTSKDGWCFMAERRTDGRD